MPQIITAILFIIFSLFISDNASAQTSNAAARTEELVAALGKTKYKKKEKKNVVIEFYMDIKNEAVVKKNIAGYAGKYICEDGDYRVELRISADGRVEGNGTDLYFDGSNFDKEKSKNFTFQNAKIEGALLTATKVFDNGQTLQFEAVFVNRTVRSGKNANEIETSETKYGLGFIQTNDVFTNRVFCEFMR
jgi:hypothetical protein